uniref:ABC transporter permease n=1 Tax=Pricia sp. TaxID=2268138 RepID=UPI00359428F0
MIKYIYKYDLILLFRASWIQALLLIFLFIFLFAGYNGKQQTIARNSEIEKARTEVASNDAKMRILLDSIERGLTITSEPYWTLPNEAAAVGNYYPRVAYKPPSDLSFVALGQSDIYTHTVKPILRSDATNLHFTELRSSVNLLFGSFDLAFVIVYLLPLIIIALSYNVLSYEREHGSLKLLASQPISIFNWTFQKVIFRYITISVMIILTLLITFLVNGVSIIENFTGFVWLAALSLLYALFWFVVAFVVNLSAGSSAKNAITLLGIWVLFVLLIPSILNLSANTIY